jgi:AraC-like DNA-binding protein
VSDDVLSLARAYVRRCFERQSPPRVSELASEIGLSRVQINRYFCDLHGITPTEFLKMEQIEEAKRLLRETALTVTQIAYCAGFGTRRTLHRAFFRATGMSPHAYRRACQNVPRPPGG